MTSWQCPHPVVFIKASVLDAGLKASIDIQQMPGRRVFVRTRFKYCSSLVVQCIAPQEADKVTARKGRMLLTLAAGFDEYEV